MNGYGSIMPTFAAMPEEDKRLVYEMSDAARAVMHRWGVKPRNDDAVARFDEACAVYLKESQR